MMRKQSLLYFGSFLLAFLGLGLVFAIVQPAVSQYDQPMLGVLAPQTLIIEASQATEAPAFSRQSPFTVTWRTLVTEWDGTVISTSLWYRHNQGAWVAALLTPSTEFSGTFWFAPPGDGRYAFTTMAYTDTPSVPALAFAGDVTTTYDTLAPTIQLTAPRQISATQIPLAWRVDDSLSGVLSYTVAYSSTGTGWQTWPRPVSKTIVITEFSALPDTCYTFRLRAHDRAGNHDAAYKTTCVGPFEIYLPLMLQNYHNVPLQNGGFETGGWDTWQYTQDLLPTTLMQDAAQAYAGQWSALIGNAQASGQGDVPLGNGRLAQTFSVPQMAATPVITVYYHFYSQDVVRSPTTQNYLDSFELYLNIFPSDANTPTKDDPERLTRCVNALGVPSATPVEGLVFCDGRATDTEPNDLGWRAVALDLSAHEGTLVTLYISSFNRQDGWYNTYVYVDEVQTNW